MDQAPYAPENCCLDSNMVVLSMRCGFRTCEENAYLAYAVNERKKKCRIGIYCNQSITSFCRVYKVIIRSIRSMSLQGQ